MTESNKTQFDNLRKQTLSGFGWNTIVLLASRGGIFLTDFILARLLLVSDFGIIGIARSFSYILLALTDLGLSAAIIQKRQIKDEELNASFWVNVFAGLLFFISFFLLSPKIASFYKMGELKNVLRVYSITIVIASFSSVHRAMLTKSMNFKKIAFYDTMGTIISSIVSIILAINGFGVWSLVWGIIIYRIFTSIILFFTVDIPINTKMKIKNISSLFKVGAWYSLSQITNQLGNQIDVMTIGKFLNEIAVGLYSYAYTISIGIPITINSIISSVMFPAFSIIQGNVKQLKKIYLISTKMLSILSFPLMISIFFTIEPVVLLIMGQKWEKLIPLVQILCIAGLSTGIGGPLWGTILKAIGKTKTFFFLTCLRMVSILFFVFTGANWGVNGVAWSISIYSIIFRFIYQSIINKYINMNMGEYLRAIIIGFLPSIPMVLWMIFINNLITFGNIIYIFFFIICLIIGLIIYLYSFRIIYPEDFLLLFDYLSQISLLNNFTKRIKKLFNV